MEDNVICAMLVVANKFLEDYKHTVLLVAQELAKRKSLYVFENEDSYEGNLGCFETGADSICLHGKKDLMNDDTLHDKALEFELQWRDKFAEWGIKDINLTGFY